MHQAEKLQRAILKADEDQAAITAAAIAQLTSPVGEERQDEEKDRPTADEKGSNRFSMMRINKRFSSFVFLSFRRSIEEFRFSIKCRIEESTQP